jgi:two-component system, sensor histidine kinase PdtaS
MTNRLLLLIVLLFPVITTFCQEIRRQEADSMLIALDKSKGDPERIDLLLNIAQFHIFKPGESKIDLDSASLYINRAKELAKYVKSPAAQGYLLLTESYLMKERGEKINEPPYFISAEGKATVEKAIAVLESGDNQSYLGQAYFELASYFDYRYRQEYPKKVVLIRRSIDAFRQAKDYKRTARSLEMLGDLHMLKKEFAEASTALEEALSIYESIGHTKLQGVYLLLGDCYRWKQDYGKALTYLLKALKTEKTGEDTPTMRLCQINNILGLFYHDIDRCDNEAKYMTDALEIARMLDDRSATFLLTINLALAYCDLHKPEQALKVLGSSAIPEKTNQKSWYSMGYLNAYTQLQQFDLARPHCDTLMMLAEKKMVNDYIKDNIYRTVATYFFSMNEYKKARYYLSKCIDIENRTHLGNDVMETSRLLYKLDSVNGDFRSAFTNLQAYTTMMDSVTSARKVLQFQVLAVEYEVGMKEDSIKLKDREILLLTQRNRLQQANLSQAGIIRNITVAGIVLALITIGLLYRQYRQKQKSNHLITLKNGQLQHYLSEKEWLLKEIHHRVKNNLQTIMGLLGTQSRYLRNDIAISAITDSQRRIQSMSLIHQKLYQSNNLSSIRMVDYVHELVDSLGDSFNVSNHVRFKLDIQPIELDLAHCIPIGLILNEAITNSFKHAFQSDEQGLVSISLKNTSANNYLLIIKDSGPGLPHGFLVDRSDSMGMNLMRGLCAEIGAQFIVSGQNGVQIEISFSYEPDIAVEINQTKAEPAMA